MRLPLFVAALGTIAGTGLQVTQQHLWPASHYALIALSGLFALVVSVIWQFDATKKISSCGPRLGAIQWAVIVSALILAFGQAGWRASQRLADDLPPGMEDQIWLVTGRVAGLPHANELGLRFVFEPERVQAITALTAHAVPGPATSVAPRLPQRLLVSWFGGVGALRAGDAGPDATWGELSWQALPPTVRAGERWQLALRPKALHGARNPHGFDFELWAFAQGIGASASVRAGPRDPPPRRIEAAGAWSWDGVRQAVRDRILGALAPDDANGATGRTGGGTAGIVAALVMGDQAAIDRGDWDVFRVTGVAHLMSISGLHITLFAWLAQAMLARLWRRSARLCLALPAPTAAAWGGLACATLYALFSGLGVPAQRTIAMLAIAVGVRSLGLVWPAPVLWAVVCAGVLVLDPWAVLQAGFWLSFVAVGVLFAQGQRRANDHAAQGRDGAAAGAVGPAQARMAQARVGHATRWLQAHGRALMREQWQVTLALVPLTVVLFGQVSLVGLVANLMAIPWVTLVVTPLAFLGSVFTPLLPAAAAGVDALLALLRPMAGWPWAVVSLPTPPSGLAAVALVGAWVAALDFPRPWRAAGAALVLPMLAWRPPGPAAGQFELIAADIGQGHAVIVRTERHVLVYDTGPRHSRESDAGHRVLVPLLRALGMRVDRVLVSHRDVDHSGGASAVLAAHAGADLLSSAPELVAPELTNRRARCEAGQAWAWDGVRFEVLHPPAPAYGLAPPWRPNAMSCVLRIESVGGAAALLTGDIEAIQEQALVASAGPQLRADWLLVPHHGSRTSSTAPFIAAVAPRIAVVQAGYRNRFGHPVGEVAARYAAAGARLVENVHCGAAQWTSAAPQQVRCERDEQRRYWQHQAPPRATAASSASGP